MEEIRAVFPYFSLAYAHHLRKIKATKPNLKRFSNLLPIGGVRFSGGEGDLAGWLDVHGMTTILGWIGPTLLAVFENTALQLNGPVVIAIAHGVVSPRITKIPRRNLYFQCVGRPMLQ